VLPHPAPAARRALPVPSGNGHGHNLSGRLVEVTKSKGAYTAFGYQSATTANRDGRVTPAGSGDAHLEHHRERLVDQARDFQRNNGIFSGMIERASAYVVGNGFGLQAKTDDPKWNAEAERLFGEWWEKPEVRQLDSGDAIEQLVCSELMTAGDVGVVKTKLKLIQVIESEQIRGQGNARDGITKDKVGRPTSYSVAPYGRSGAPEIAKAEPVSPENFLFITRRMRPSATRTAPPLQSVFPMLHRINDVCDSEAIAWQMLARIAISVSRSNAQLDAFQQSTADPEQAGNTEGRPSTRVTELDYALIFHGEPGDEVKGIDRNIPGKDFPASLSTFLRLLGLPLGLPLEVILLDWTKSNYSQSRAVLEQAFVSFRRWQSVLEKFFHRPVYRWFIESAVAARQLSARPNMFKHEWIKSTFPWIDQLKEAEAWSMKLDRSFSTQAQVLKSLGLDRDEVLTTREREVREAIAIANKIKTDTGVDVPYQTFAGLAVPSAAPAQPAAEKGKRGKPAEEDDDEEDADAKFSVTLGEVEGPMVAKGVAGILRSRREAP
jgi:lambda family phage portal protein